MPSNSLPTLTLNVSHLTVGTTFNKLMHSSFSTVAVSLLELETINRFGLVFLFNPSFTKKNPRMYCLNFQKKKRVKGTCKEMFMSNLIHHLNYNKYTSINDNSRNALISFFDLSIKITGYMFLSSQENHY